MIDPKVVPLRATDRCVVCGQPCEARCPEHAYSQSKMPLLERWRIGLLLLSGAACIAYGGILVFILYKGTPDVDHATFSGGTAHHHVRHGVQLLAGLGTPAAAA